MVEREEDNGRQEGNIRERKREREPMRVVSGRKIGRQWETRGQY